MSAALIHIADPSVPGGWRPATAADFAGAAGGGGGDASAANQATQITRETEIRDRLPASIGPKTAANSLAVTLASDGPLVTAVGQPADAAATSDTGTFGVLAFVKRALQNWTTLLARIPALASGRVPVETVQQSGSVTVTRLRDIIYDVVSIASVAVNTTVTGATIDLGASHSTCTVICHKASGTNQADTVSIEQSDDGTNWYQVPRSDAPYGNAVAFSSTSGVNCVVNGRPCMRYVRGKLTTFTAGSLTDAVVRVGRDLVTAIVNGSVTNSTISAVGQAVPEDLEEATPARLTELAASGLHRAVAA